MDKFWFVWNPNGNTPRYKHPTKESAEKEADRLAQQCRFEKFFVLEAMSLHEIQPLPVQRTELVVPALPGPVVDTQEGQTALADDGEDPFYNS